MCSNYNYKTRYVKGNNDNGRLKPLASEDESYGSDPLANENESNGYDEIP